MQVPGYEELMERVLARVPEGIDKREGSLIWTAVGPVCAELAQGYMELDAALSLAFPDTSSGEYLHSLPRQSGLSRTAARAAVCRGEFTGASGEALTVPSGMRFGVDGIFYKRGDLIEEGAYELICETPGTEGNRASGALLPVDYLENLGSAQITALLVPGLPEESDEELRERLLEQAAAPAFGGNIADYKEKAGALPGVGAVKVEVTPNGGGTVGLCILGADLLPAGAEVVSAVQQAADPEAGAGKGFAPIGHVVTVRAAASREIDVQAELTLSESAQEGPVLQEAEEALEAYLDALRKEWAEQDRLVVRVSQAMMALLAVDGVLDATVKLDGQTVNMELDTDEVPVLGEVSITAAEKETV